MSASGAKPVFCLCSQRHLEKGLEMEALAADKHAHTIRLASNFPDDTDAKDHRADIEHDYSCTSIGRGCLPRMWREVVRCPLRMPW
jgi:hypothetical protein